MREYGSFMEFCEDNAILTADEAYTVFCDSKVSGFKKLKEKDFARFWEQHHEIMASIAGLVNGDNPNLPASCVNLYLRGGYAEAVANDSHCSNMLDKATEERREKRAEAHSKSKCPRCGCTELHYEKRGQKVGRGVGTAVVAGVLTGGIGALAAGGAASLAGRNKVRATCTRCGKQFVL